MVKTKSKLSKEVEIFRKLIQNDAQFGIILALYYYKSLKLKQLAKFIGKTNPTTLHHIKQLSDQGLLELDQNKIVGKYYVLSDLGIKMMSDMFIGGDDESALPEKLSKQEEVDIMANALVTMGITVKNIVKHAAYYLKTTYLQLRKKKKKSDYTTRISVEDMHIRTKDHMDKLSSLMEEFDKALKELKEETKVIQEGDLDSEFMVFYMAVPLTIMHPEKIDEAMKEQK